MALTQDDVVKLLAPLPLEEGHEVRIAETYGTRARWLVYTTEDPITTRLTEVDPNWGLRVAQIVEGAASVAVVAELTLCGVARVGIGGASPKKAGAPVDHDVIKAAATDALKRAARLFGVGAYLLGAPRITTDWKENASWEERRALEADAFAQFARWYRKVFGGGPAPASERVPAPGAEAEADQPATPALTPAPAETAREEYDPDLDVRPLTSAIWERELAPALMRRYGYKALPHAANSMFAALVEAKVLRPGEKFAALYSLDIPVHRVWRAVESYKTLQERAAAAKAEQTEQPEQPALIDAPVRPAMSDVDVPPRQQRRKAG